jgi:hypothetical protein
MLSRWATPSLLLGVLLLLGSGESLAYFPCNCFPDYAKNDFKESALVVIGRVTAIQRYRIPLSAAGVATARRSVWFFYVATITVGRTLKGKAKPGEDILFCTGSYEQRSEDDTEPTRLRVANSHPAWTLDYNHVYLLALDPDRWDPEEVEQRRDGKWTRTSLENREVWKPRSCHWSVHEVMVRHRRVPEGAKTKGKVQQFPAAPPIGADTQPGELGTGVVRIVSETFVSIYFDRWEERTSKQYCVPLDEFIAALKQGKLPPEKDPTPFPADSPNEAGPAKAKK